MGSGKFSLGSVYAGSPWGTCYEVTRPQIFKAVAAKGERATKAKWPALRDDAKPLCLYSFLTSWRQFVSPQTNIYNIQ